MKYEIILTVGYDSDEGRFTVNTRYSNILTGGYTYKFKTVIEIEAYLMGRKHQFHASSDQDQGVTMRVIDENHWIS